MISRSVLTVVLAVGLTGLASATGAKEITHPRAIEIVTSTLQNGVDIGQFKKIDRQIQSEYVSRQPGFISREAALGNGNKWLVIVHWRTTADARASMRHFAGTSAAAKVVPFIVPNSMTMKLYDQD